MNDLNSEQGEASNHVETQDDLLDDLMNIVQNDFQENTNPEKVITNTVKPR